MNTVAARRLRISGHVQGVGFRPFVYRLAQELQLAGTVQNLQGEVEIVVQGTAGNVERFCREVTSRAPPLARPRLSSCVTTEAGAAGDFRILDSAAAGETRIFVPPDGFLCADCRAELEDPANRRYRHPFINCTQCGPRYTVIEALPYDRARTTLSGFPLCPACRKEYEDPRDRRFHAEPIACPDCGPSVWLTGQGLRLEREAALSRAVEMLRAGAVLAVKGVGGYHLLCDAASEEAVATLRTRKHRPDKPLAVMFPEVGADGLEQVRAHAVLGAGEARLLTSAARPIVLVRRRPDSSLAAGIAPGLGEIGVFLPYSPLHHLLLAGLGRPAVATSGNLSGEPVQTDPEAAAQAFDALADACLHHDRPIARPADDSVMRVTRGRPQTLRVGRGLGPLELSLPVKLPHPVLAVGGHLKTAIALGFEDRMVVSPHIADMGTVRSEQVLTQVVADLQRLYGVRAEQIVCDAHRGYVTSRWARRQGLPVAAVWHHEAHASGLAAQHDPVPELLVFAWDGTGLGADGSLWGGETFRGNPGRWQRVASLRPFRLPGGDLASRSPWRCAAALCWELGLELPGLADWPLVQAAWRRGVNSPRSSSVGRVFDAAAALVLGLAETSHEGQGPMELEALATAAQEDADSPVHDPLVRCSGLPGHHDPDGLLRMDWAPLVAMLSDERTPPAERAWRAHAVLAATITEVAVEERRRHDITHVGLTGGVFQNALLTRLAHEQLEAAGLRVLCARDVPCNDGGLAHGQLIEWAAKRGRRP